jgi:MFS family permease
VREFVFMIVAIAVALAWMGIWAYCLHLFGFAFFAVFSGKPEDRASRRERIKQMGKLRYILMFGVLGFGLALGLGITTADLLAHESHGWVAVVGKLVLLSVLGGWFQGARIWSEVFRDPVPFPPNYPPTK